MIDDRATPGRFARTWLRSLLFFAVGVDLLQNFNDARSARDRFIEMKEQVRREFHSHSPGEFGLKGDAMLFEPGHDGFRFFRSEDADENMRALQIGTDVNVIDGDKGAFKTDFAGEDSAQFPFYHFVYAQHSMFHKTLSFPSKFLGHRFELVALDDVADVVFAEIAELDTAFQARADFLHVVLETAERGKSAIINRLTLADYSGASGPSDSPIGHQTAGHDTFAQLEDLFHFGVSDDGFAEFRLEHSRHRVFDLVDQFVNDAVKLDLNAFPFRGRHRDIFNLSVESDDNCVGRPGQQNVRLRNRPDRGMNDVELDLLTVDLTERGADRFDRSLRVAFQHEAQRFLAVGRFEQRFERRPLRYAQFFGALRLQTFVAQSF